MCYYGLCRCSGEWRLRRHWKWWSYSADYHMCAFDVTAASCLLWQGYNTVGLMYTHTECFIRNTCTLIYSCNYPSSQSCGSSTVYKILLICIRSFSLCSHQTSEGGKIWSQSHLMQHEHWCQTGWSEYLWNSDLLKNIQWASVLLTETHYYWESSE